MKLNVKQFANEKEQVILDLFKTKTGDPKSIFAAYSEKEKEDLLKRIENHRQFYLRIANEPIKKPSFRVEIAKFRANILYPQLIKYVNG